MNQSSFEVILLDNLLIRLQPATLLKITLLHGCFSRFLNCTTGTKSRNPPHIWTLSPKYKMALSLKTTVCEDMIFIWLSPAMKQLLEKLYFEFPHALNFYFAWHKKLAIVGNILWRFDIILHIWLIHLLFHSILL